MTFTGNLPKAKTIQPKERVALLFLLDVLKSRTNMSLSPPNVLYVRINLHYIYLLAGEKRIDLTFKAKIEGLRIFFIFL